MGLRLNHDVNIVTPTCEGSLHGPVVVDIQSHEDHALKVGVVERPDHCDMTFTLVEGHIRAAISGVDESVPTLGW